MKTTGGRKLIDELATELMLLRAAWIITADDDRQRKHLAVGPNDVRRWSKLIRRAGRMAGGALLFAVSAAGAQVPKITVSPKTATVEVGKTKQLSRIVTVVWTSSDTTIATVSQTGLVTPRKPGIVLISVSAGPTLIATSTVTIIPAAVASVQVILGKLQLVVGEKTTATAIVRDAAGNILTGRVVTWSSSNPSVATVTPMPTVMLPPKPQRVAFDWVAFDWPGKKK